MNRSIDTIAICGAGIAGVAAAYFLSVKHGRKNVVLIESDSPLSLTSDKSTEAYRNWWPGPDGAMTAFMNRSIDLIDELARSEPSRINMNRNGYLFASADPEKVAWLEQVAQTAASHGAGPVRIHNAPGSSYCRHASLTDGLDGVDIFQSPALIQQHFSYLHPDTTVVAHARRAGWLSAQQLGMLMLEAARAQGVKLVRGHVREIVVDSGQIQSVNIELQNETAHLPVDKLILTAGPMLKELAGSIGIDLPIVAERHLKISFDDLDKYIPRDAPMSIWLDEVTLNWSVDEASALNEDSSTRWLLNRMPPGVHCRPNGGADNHSVLALFTYDNAPAPVTFPIPDEPHYPDIVLRALANMIPGVDAYLNRGARPFVDGGYYIRTRENRPLVGPLPIDGLFVSGAYSGFGIMASCAGADLLARHVCAHDLPDYAPAFALSRYDDPTYVAQLDNWGDDGQI